MFQVASISLKRSPLPELLREHPAFLGLAGIPILFLLQWQMPHATTLLFAFSLVCIAPLAALLSLATEQMADRTSNAVGGLLNATLGNMTELIVSLLALRAGLFDLVKATLAGVMITNTLFALGVAFLWGGIRHHVEVINLDYVRMQSSLLLLATIALLVPSALHLTNHVPPVQIQHLSVGLSVVLLMVYLLGFYFTMFSHPDLLASVSEEENQEKGWSIPLAAAVLLAATLGLALVSTVFVDTVREATETLGVSQMFVGFILVALVGGAAEMFSAIHAAGNNRVDLSVAIAMGSSTQVSLVVAPLLVLASYFVAPQPMALQFPPAAVAMVLLSTISLITILSSRRTTWYTGVLLLAVYVVFALTLYMVP